jgi:hypothetical protein
MIWLLPPPLPLSRKQVVYFLSLPACCRSSLLTVEEEVVKGKEPCIIRQWERLVLYNPLPTLRSHHGVGGGGRVAKEWSLIWIYGEIREEGIRSARRLRYTRTLTWLALRDLSDFIWLSTNAMCRQLELTLARSWAAPSNAANTACSLKLPSQNASLILVLFSNKSRHDAVQDLSSGF